MEFFLYICGMVNNIQSTDKIIVDLEMLQIDYNEQKVQALKQEIANKYNLPLRNVEINFKPITVDVNGDKISLASDVINNTQDTNFQKDVMKDYLKIREISDVDWSDIDAIDNQVNSFIDFDQYTKYKNYKFKYVKWSNYLSYGPDNYFDFTNLHGLVLLNSDPANQGGKTTFAIDLLRFALFGKAEKSPTLDSVFNGFLPDTTEVIVEAGIEIDGEDYVIRRTITRPALKKRTAKSKCKQQLEYFKKVGDNLDLIENCEGESSTQTNNIIKDAVGNVDDFNLVISATQYSLGDLLRMGATDKGRLFSRWLGLLTIEKKEEVAKKLWKENHQTKLLSNTYNKETLKNEIEDYKTCNEEYNELINQAQEVLNTANNNIVKYSDEKTKVLTSIKPIIDNLDLVDVTTLKNNIETTSQQLTNKRGEFTKLKNEYIKLKDLSYNDDDRIAQENDKTKFTNEIHEIELNNRELKTKINALREEHNKIEKLLSEGTCPTCGHEIDIFEQNKFLSENETQTQSLINEGVANKAKINEIQVKVNACNTALENLATLKKNVDEKAKLELKLTALKTNIDNFKLVIERDTKILNDIKTNEENIKYNNEIRLKASVIDNSINNETKIKEAKIKEIEGYNGNIKKDNDEINKRLDYIKKLEAEEKLIRNWAVYQELVGKNGIIKLVLKKALPIVNNEVGRILNGLCDFEVKLNMDEKNNVTIDLLKDGVKFDMGVSGSGFEGTMASLALRSALASISTMSKPNFIVFDEVLGQTAASNLENIHEIFKRIVSNYDFVLHITHNELIADWHDGGIITVTKENNVSRIK